MDGWMDACKLVETLLVSAKYKYESTYFIRWKNDNVALFGPSLNST